MYETLSISIFSYFNAKRFYLKFYFNMKHKIIQKLAFVVHNFTWVR